jgi:uncharacterized protein (DUF1015 family)
VILPKPDGDSLKPYEAVRERLAGWLSKGIIAADEKPGIYVYQITFQEGGRQRQNLGFFALGRLEEYLERGVAPHENILPAPREDRLKLRIATQADFGPIYMLYRDREKVFEKVAASVLSRRPIAQAYDLAGDWHQLWKLTYDSDIEKTAALLASRPVLIADGHHRYDAALESHRRNPDKPWFGYRMMAFFNSEGDGISVRPIHRLISGLKFSTGELLGRLGQNFEIETLYAGGSKEDLEKALVRLAEGSDKFHRFGLTFEDSFHLISAPRSGLLDAEILEQWIFKNALGLSDEETRQYVDFSQDAGEVVRLVGEAKVKAGFLLNATRMDEVWKRAEAGQKLPPKSTFFYPKLLTGLVMNINPEFYFKKG